MSSDYVGGLPALGRARLLTASTLTAALGLLVVSAIMLVGLLNETAISPGLGIVAGVAGIGFLFLAISRYDVAVATGFVLMGIVRFEPAPVDAAFATVMAVAAITGRFRLDRTPLLARTIVIWLFVINLLSMMEATSTSVGLRFMSVSVYLAVFSLWLTAYVDSRRRAHLIVVAWLAIGVISAVVSVAMLNLPLPGRSFILGTVDNGARVSGLFKDPNVFAPFLVPLILILLEKQITNNRLRLLRMRGWTTWLCILALSLGVLFAFSRAAWGNLAIGILVLLVVTGLRTSNARAAMRTLIVLIVIATVAGGVLSATGQLDFLQSRAQVQNYDTNRFAAQHFGYELGWSHPVGVGPGQFQYHFPVEAHSTYVRVFAEQGIFGELCWLTLLIGTLVFALRNVALGRDTYGIGSAALLGAWCGLIFNSVVVDTLHWRHLWVVAALIWAGAMRVDRGAGRAQTQVASARTGRQAVPVAATRS